MKHLHPKSCPFTASAKESVNIANHDPRINILETGKHWPLAVNNSPSYTAISNSITRLAAFVNNLICTIQQLNDDDDDDRAWFGAAAWLEGEFAECVSASHEVTNNNIKFM